MVRFTIKSTSGISKTVARSAECGTPYLAACADARLKSISAHAMTLTSGKRTRFRQVLVADVTATDDGNSDWFKSIAHKMFLAELVERLSIGGKCIRAELLGNPGCGNFRGFEVCRGLGHIDFDNDPTVKR